MGNETFKEFLERRAASINKKREDTSQTNQDLAAHEHDQGNIRLGFHSIHLVNGHAGNEVTYYSELRQVVVQSYCITSDKTTDTIERIPIPEDIALRNSDSEILEYAKDKSTTVKMVCR